MTHWLNKQTNLGARNDKRIETPFEAYIRWRHETNHRDDERRGPPKRRDRWTTALV